MGRDAFVEGSEAFEPVARESFKDVVGNVAHNLKEETQDVVEVVKEKAHYAAETIKWQAGEIRDGVSKRMSADNGVPTSSVVAEEPVLVPMTPIAKDPFATKESNGIADVVPVDLELARQRDLPREKDAVIVVNPVVTMHVEQCAERPVITAWDRVFQAKLALEENAHNMRLKMDDILKYRLGDQADRIQEEFEKTRVSAIAGTAYMAELFQDRFRKVSSMLRNQNRSAAAPTVIAPASPETIGEVKHADRPSEVPNPSQIEESAEHVAKTGTFSRLTALRLVLGAEDTQSMASDPAYVTDLIEEQFGRLASSLREQEQHGIVPAYR